MNKIKHTSLSFEVILFFAIIFLSSCGGSNTPPSTTEVNQKILTSGLWKVSSVKVDDTDQTVFFTGFTLQFGFDTFTSTNGKPVWPSGGMWHFTDESATTLTRDDGVAITISTLSETGLVFTLTWDKVTLGGGRVASVKGTHTFTMTK